MAIQTQILGAARRLLTAISAGDGGAGAPPRLNQLNDLVTANVFNGMQQAAAEGSYFVFSNVGTRNTGVTMTNATGVTYAAIQALVVVANTNQPGGPDVILDSFSFKQDGLVTAGTFWHVYHAMDTGNRYSSGGAQMTGYATNGVSGSPSGVLAYSGVVVAAAATGNVRDVGYNLILNGVGTVQALTTIKFGCQEAPSGLFVTPTATSVSQYTVYAPPIVIAPGWCYVMNEFQTARTAAPTGEMWLNCIVR